MIYMLNKEKTHEYQTFGSGRVHIGIDRLWR